MNTSNFKKEWSPADFKIVENKILKYFKSRPGQTIKTSKGVYPVTNFTNLDNILGLAYTSSGEYACLSVCNAMTWLDLDNRFYILNFSLSNEGDVIMECCDRMNNELYILI